MAYLIVDRLWHGTHVPLLRVSMPRPRALAQLATIARRHGSTPRGEHGDLVVTVAAHHGGTRLEDPVYVGAAHSRLLLTDDFDATPAMLAHLLSAAYAERHADARRRHASDEPPAR
jgi:hypothetical protein